MQPAERLRREQEEYALIQAGKQRQQSQSQSTQNRRELESIDLTIEDSPEPQPQPPHRTSLPPPPPVHQRPLDPYPNQSNPQASSSSRQQQQSLGGHSNPNLQSQNLSSGFKPFSLPGISVNPHRQGGPGPARTKEFESRNQREETRYAPSNSGVFLKRPPQISFGPSSSTPQATRAWKSPQQQTQPQPFLDPAERYRRSFEAKERRNPRQSLPDQSQSFHNQPRPENNRRHSSSHSQHSNYDRDRRNDSREPSRRFNERDENDYSHDNARGGAEFRLDPSQLEIVQKAVEQVKQNETGDPLASSTSSNDHSPHFSLNKQERDLQLQQTQPSSTSRSRLPSSSELPSYPHQLPPSHPHSHSQAPASTSLARSNSRDSNVAVNQPHHPSRLPPITQAQPWKPLSPSQTLWNQEENQDSEMAPRTATPITPGDPSAKYTAFSSQASTSRGGYGKDIRNGKIEKVRAAGGGGSMRPDFNDDEDDAPSNYQASSSGNGKGKGKQPAGKGIAPQRGFLDKAMAQATAASNKAHSGKSSGRGGQNQASAVQKMPPIQKKQGSGKRIIQQDDEPTQMEQATQLIMQGHERSAASYGTKHRVGDQQSIAIKGKGKEKQTEVVELSSSDDDEEEDGRGGQFQSKGRRRERAASDITSPGGSGEEDELGMPGAYSSKPILPKNNRRHLSANQHDDPSSDDPIRMGGSTAMRKGGSANGSGLGGGNVQGKINHFEELGGGKGKQKAPVASSLAPRGASKPRTQPIPNLDGAGTDGTDDYPQSATTTTTTTIKGAASKNKKKKGKSPDLEPVIDLPIKPFMIGREVVAPGQDRYFLKFTTGATVKSQKITIGRRNERGTMYETEIKAESIHNVEWMIFERDNDRVAFSFRFQTKPGKEILEELSLDWLSPAETESYTKELLVVTKESLTDISKWRQTPTTSLEKVLYSLNKWLPNDDRFFGPIISGKCVSFFGQYQGLLAASEERAAESEERSSRQNLYNRGSAASTGKSKDKTNSLQLSLPFVKPKSDMIPQSSFYSNPNQPDRRPPQLAKDQQGDWVQSNETSNAQPRRSTRETRPTHKAAINRPPVEKDPYPTDHVVLEYPIGEAGAVTVTWGDKKRLNDEEFLNDTLIEYGLKKAMVDVKRMDQERPDSEKVAPVVHVFNSFFYKKLSSGKNTAEAVKNGNFSPYFLVQKWTKKFDLFSKKYIIVPINEHLHWYLAVIVNPRWIIDAADQFLPAIEAQAETAPATRGRTSTATTNDNSVTLSSSSQPGSPTVASNEVTAAETKSRFFDKKKKNTEVGTPSKAEEEDEDEMEIDENEKSEEEIQAQLRPIVEKTEMGGEEDERDEVEGDEDEDATMADENVEGGGPSNGQGDPLVLSDDDEDEPIVPESIEQVASTSKTAQGSASTRTAVPIGAPTAPPKGASSPPKAASPPLVDEPMADEEVSAADLARELGADESAADRCWIFTFDSLGGKHDTVVTKLKNYLDMEAKTKKFKKWTAAANVQGVTVRVPQQPNFCDCGLYILHFVEQFLSDPAAMTRYIVAREHPKKGIVGSGQEVNRKRAARKERIRQLDAAIIKEDAWKEEVALEKRRTMRAEVEGLMQQYLPIKVAKDAKEAEEKRQRDKKREERDAREGGAGGDARKEKEREVNEQEKRLAEQQAAAKQATKSRSARGKKKVTEVVVLEDSDDDAEDNASMAGSPKKTQPIPPPPPTVDPVAPAKPSSSSSSQQRQPANSDFFPSPVPAPAAAIPLAHPPSSSSNQPRAVPSPFKSSLINTSLAPKGGLVDYESDEDEGDLGNTQEEQEEEMKRVRPRDPLADDHDDDAGQSPPNKRKKRNISQSPPKPRSPTPPPPAQQQQQRSPTPVQSQPDSSIEIRAPLTPDLAAPPANQQQLVEDKATSSSTGKTRSAQRSSARHKGKGEGDGAKEVEMLELD